MKKVVLIGAGRLAFNLAIALHKKEYTILQVYNRDNNKAKELASLVKANYTSRLEEINTEADLYFCAIKDDAIEKVLPYLQNISATIVHSSGTVSIDVFKKHFIKTYGVFYPMQTFTTNRLMDFSHIPIFVEASSKEVLDTLLTVANDISNKVQEISSIQRKQLHLSAVFANNFVNHMYVIAEDLLKETKLDASVLHSLMQETLDKAISLGAENSQTGPAVRDDQSVMREHLQLLKDNTIYTDIYKNISKSINKNTIK